MALTAIMDTVPTKNATGQELFSDFNDEGCPTHIGVRGGRGLGLAFGIKEPVITEILVACCCVNLAYHLMVCRRHLQPTDSKVFMVWEKVLKEKLYFVRDIVWDENLSKADHVYISIVEKICRDIRSTLPQERGLLLLTAIMTVSLETP